MEEPTAMPHVTLEENVFAQIRALPTLEGQIREWQTQMEPMIESPPLGILLPQVQTEWTRFVEQWIRSNNAQIESGGTDHTELIARFLANPIYRPWLDYIKFANPKLKTLVESTNPDIFTSDLLEVD